MTHLALIQQKNRHTLLDREKETTYLEEEEEEEDEGVDKQVRLSYTRTSRLTSSFKTD